MRCMHLSVSTSESLSCTKQTEEVVSLQTVPNSLSKSPRTMNFPAGHPSKDTKFCSENLHEEFESITEEIIRFCSSSTHDLKRAEYLCSEIEQYSNSAVASSASRPVQERVTSILCAVKRAQNEVQLANHSVIVLSVRHELICRLLCISEDQMVSIREQRNNCLKTAAKNSFLAHEYEKRAVFFYEFASEAFIPSAWGKKGIAV